VLNVGKIIFQKALASYIRKFAYSNAKTEDLWAVLEENSGEPIKNMMTTWTKQQGYPVINAKLQGNYLELEQVFIIHCLSRVIFALINM
jgi:aminopeptidase N